MKVNNETKVGALTIIALATLYLGYSFLKGQAIFSKQQVFYAVYKHASGLNVANKVQVNGVQVGRVTRFTINRRTGNIVTRFVVDKDIPVPKNSIAKIVSSDFLGQKEVQLVIGDANQLALSGDTLLSAKQMDLTETVRQEVLPVKLKAEDLLSSMDSVLTLVHYMLDKRSRESIRKSLSSIENAMRNITSTSYTLDTFMSAEVGRLQEIFANVESITTNFKKHNKQIAQLMNNMSAISDSVRQSNLKQTIASTEQALQNFSETMDKVNRGEGSLGMLVHDDSLYHNLNRSARDLDQLLIDMRAHPDRYVHFSIMNFGSGKKKTRRKAKEKEKERETIPPE